MKLKSAFGTALCAAAALTAFDAKANPPAEDLILCFEATGGTGASTDLEVDLGNYGSPLLSVNVASALASTFGSNWDSDGDVEWAVVGVNSSTVPLSDGIPADTLWLTANPGDGGQSGGTASQQHGPAAAALGIYSSFGQGTAVSGLGTSAITIGNTETDSFTNENDNSTEAILNEFSADEDVANGTTSMDLYECLPGSGGGTQNDVNTFTLASNGEFTAAVPEPSTWATVILGIGSLIAFGRRRLKA